MIKNTTLLYIHDPMCSWCYGYKPIFTEIRNTLKNKIPIKYLLGGLAPDTDCGMTSSMKKNIIDNWKNIQKTIPGTTFNYDFWTQCKPRRSTYPSCRAVIAATKQQIDCEEYMIDEIQTAYYLHAKNPSDYSVLYDLAENLKLNKDLFITDIHSENTDAILKQQMDFCRSIGADTFPSLYLLINQKFAPVILEYKNADVTLENIDRLINL